MNAFALVDFRVRRPVVRLGDKTLIATFGVQSGVLAAPGWNLAITDDGLLHALKPRADKRAFRLRCTSASQAAAILCEACAFYQRETGQAPDSSLIAGSCPREAFEDAGTINDDPRDSSPPRYDQGRAAPASHYGRERGAGR